MREFRHRLVDRADELAAAVKSDVGRAPNEVFATDLVPTASAAKFLERRAGRLLAPRRVGGRPLWLWGCQDVVHRRPRGVIGLIGTWNYPIFLNAIPILHALAAGNGVLWKPSEQAPRTAEILHDLFPNSGFPADLVRVLPATREAGPRLAEADIDHLHFTGSETVGRKLAARLGERLIPSTLELSGCDAMFVLKDADVPSAARLAWFGTTLNSGQTCTAVRRAFVHRAIYESFVEQLEAGIGDAKPVRLVTPREAERRAEIVDEAVARGCGTRTTTGDLRPIVVRNPNGVRGLAANRDSLFAPLLTVTPFDSLDDAIALAAESPFRLSASIFSSDLAAANELAARLPIVAVTINDVIVPTAHPGTPFGGRGASGWGVSQGDEGLLEMTVPQVVSVRRGGFTPHSDANSPPEIPRGYLRLVHGRGVRQRWRGFRQLLAGIRRRAPTSTPIPASPETAAAPPTKS